MSTTFLVFPLTILSGSIFMQLGSYLSNKIHPKLQMGLGGFCFAFPVFACSFIHSFPLFAFVYVLVMGFGFGLIYMLPIRNAWLFYKLIFDSKIDKCKISMVSGIILCSYSIGAICWSFTSTALANPNNDPTTIKIKNGISYEKLFGPDSDVAMNTPGMLRTLSYIFFCMAILSTLLITKKPDDSKKSKQIMYIGGDYYTDATVTPFLTPGRSVGAITPKREVDQQLDFQDQEHLSPRFTAYAVMKHDENITDQEQIKPPKPDFENEEPLLHQRLSETNPKMFSEILNSKIKKVSNAVTRNSLRGMTLKEIMSHITFWHIFIMLMFSMSFSYFMKPAMKNYGSQKSYDDAFLTFVNGLAFFVSFVAKFAWGILQDKLGFFKVYGMMLLLKQN